MINKIFLLGNAGKDPNFSITENGKSYCRVSVATNENKDKATWHNLVAWEKSAEMMRDYVHAGDTIYVEGRVQYGEFVNRDNQKVKTTDIIVDRFRTLGKREKKLTDTDNMVSSKVEVPIPF